MRRLLLLSAEAPEHSVQWVQRERTAAGSSHDGIGEVELPEDWSTEAAQALLEQGGGDRASVREWVRAVSASFAVQGRGADVRLALDDVTQWRAQLEALLLTQSAAVCLPDVSRRDAVDDDGVPVHACAGLRLTRFLEPDGRLNHSALRQAIRLILLVLLLAREWRDAARPGSSATGPQVCLLDLGAFLMASGVPYDSDTGRAISAAVSAMVSADLTLHGQGWGALPPAGSRAAESTQPIVAEAQRRLQALDRLQPPEERIISIRRDAVTSAQESEQPPPLVRQLPELLQIAKFGWGEIARRARRNEMGKLVLMGRSHAWMAKALDCDGDELLPLSALTEMERRRGETAEGAQQRRRAKHAVRAGLNQLRYTAWERDAIIRELEKGGDMASTGLEPRHQAVFAVRGMAGKTPALGSRSEERMHAAMQLFADLAAPGERGDTTRASGSPSQGGEIVGHVDVPDSRLRQEHAALLAMRVSEEKPAELVPQTGDRSEETAPGRQGEESRGAGFETSGKGTAWVAGTGGSEHHAVAPEGAVAGSMPAERQAVTHSFRIAGREGTLTVGLFQDGRLGEIYLRMPRESSAVKGLLDAFSMATSVALQHGATLSELTRQFAGLHFEPSGETANPEIPTAQSPMDYLFRWLALRFAPLVSSS